MSIRTDYLKAGAQRTFDRWRPSDTSNARTAALGGKLSEERLVTHANVACCSPAAVLFAAGDVERAFQFLSEAVRRGDRRVSLLLTGTSLSEQCRNPEFLRLASALGLDAMMVE